MKFSLNEKEEKKLLSLFDQHEKNLDYYIYLSHIFNEKRQLLSFDELKKSANKNDFEIKNLAFDKLENLYKNDNSLYPVLNKIMNHYNSNNKIKLDIDFNPSQMV